MSRRKSNQRNRTEGTPMEQNVDTQEEEIINTEDTPESPVAEEENSPGIATVTDVPDEPITKDAPDEKIVPVIEELNPEHMTLSEQEPATEQLPADTLGEEDIVPKTHQLVDVIQKDPTPKAPPLVNTIQNLASDTQVSTWENRDPSNTLYGVINNVLNNYESTMKAKMPVNKTVGAQKQTELYQIIVRVAQSRNHFKTNWELILKHFYENPTGCYSANYVMRFLDGMQVTKNDITLFTRLLNLIMFTADPSKVSENLRRVSIEKTLSNVSSPVIRANITGYYRNFVS